MKKRFAAAAVAVAAVSMTGSIANAVPGPPSGISGTGTISVKTSQEQLCLTALGGGAVVGKPCLRTLNQRKKGGQLWEVSRYDGSVEISAVGKSNMCLGNQPGIANAQLVSCSNFNEDGDGLRYIALGASACPGIDTSVSGCAEIALKTGIKLTAWIASQGHAESYAVVRWEDGPVGMYVRFTWEMPKLSLDH
jgi:hypothetical protein